MQLTRQQQEKIARLAQQMGRPWEEVLDNALAALERRTQNGKPMETVHEAMTRLGLLGCIKDAPADLSTDPKHMEGFGANG